AGFHGDQGGPHHLAFHAEPSQFPIHHIPRGGSLVADSQPLVLPQLLYQLPDRPRSVRNPAQRPYLTSWLRDRNGDRVGVDIQTDKTYVLHDRLLRFAHLALVEIDEHCCNTLETNRPHWKGRVHRTDLKQFDATPYRGVDLLAAGLPCPPFSVAGKQLGDKDE